jgi:hypothetical protein
MTLNIKIAKPSARNIILRKHQEIKGPRAALMQPTFLPWQGFFGLILSSDIFVFLDDFQFCRRSYHQRNRLFLPNRSVAWATVPVEHTGNSDCKINEVKPLLGVEFIRKFERTLQQAYGKTPHFDDIFPLIIEWILKKWDTLAEMNIDFIKMVADLVGLKSKFITSSEIYTGCSVRSQRLEAILETIGAASYLSARGSYSYMREDGIFPINNIETYFQHFVPKPYRQIQTKDFVSHLSVLDSLFQIGTRGTLDVLIHSQEGFIIWDDMPQELEGGPFFGFEHLDQR